jgi:uncharacterized protein YbaR (Trm112 family)
MPRRGGTLWRAFLPGTSGSRLRFGRANANVSGESLADRLDLRFTLSKTSRRSRFLWQEMSAFLGPWFDFVVDDLRAPLLINDAGRLALVIANERYPLIDGIPILLKDPDSTEYLTKEIIRGFWGFTPCRFGIIIAPRYRLESR